MIHIWKLRSASKTEYTDNFAIMISILAPQILALNQRSAIHNGKSLALDS